ncbi:Cyclopropane-fatty-acyl-phospholipid synthase [Posidoniimonas polymericola]|uniref:Cyclopropane-fatty-acyl-phospholipid synthase n=1 Tax=Posidoniimonas polymericola TaxID=2528002 RepID=A0A5C5YMH5_9BACT|nr:cyclopropane-fatty-acyl-phospholipid synthase family protein [Posidoniimonas polymericola]TWT76124.1 Cyclopropane-fatty-acyl-phospholipid synthase [Posidoniimonas polymericola]
MNVIDLAESRLLPDWLIRAGIRRLLAQRKQNPQQAERRASVQEFADQLRQGPLAIATDAANEQHYEAPAAFFNEVLGPRLKYSCCLFDDPNATLRQAEEAMLTLTCSRADLQNGQRILELGCGWGSLSLWMAEKYPDAQVTAVSNSNSQREFIQARAGERRLENLEVITANVTEFEPAGTYDRVVSVEMFEHMRNYEELFRRVSSWLEPDGVAFVHVFCHAGEPYLFEDNGPNDWMSRHFFTGGTMPSDDLFACFDKHLRIAEQWRVDGTHYWRTCEHWLQNLDATRPELLKILGEGLEAGEAKRMLQRWRMFFMACAELFRYEEGQRWLVCHYRFEQAASPQTSETRPLAHQA